MDKKVLVLDGDCDLSSDPGAIDSMIDQILAFLDQKPE